MRGLAVMLPLRQGLAPLSVSPATSHLDAGAAKVLATGISQCPTGFPKRHQCDPGAAPATLLQGSVAAYPRHARAPDLHALNISHT